MTIYIDAMSAFTPLGELNETWERINKGEVGYNSITKFDPSEYRRIKSNVAGEYHFDISKYSTITDVDAGRLPEHMIWALGLTEDLLQGRELPKDRTAVMISPGISIYLECLHANKNKIDSAYTFTPNMIAHNVNIKHGFTGPSSMSVTSCASGIYNFIIGCMMIETGQADYVIAGSVDKSIEPDAYLQMGKLRALSTQCNDNPTTACKPWDVNRDGIVLSEGGGLMLLSKYKSENTIAQISGYGMSNDAYQVVAPHPDGSSIEQCMNLALKGRKPELVNAHATGTPMGDYAELDAIYRVGLEDAYVTANKSQLGHLMSAAGTVETILSVLSVSNDIVTPTANSKEFKEGYNPNIVSTGTKAEINSVLCNSFGFGGTNSSILIEKT